jgi:hypothetical protein
MINTERVDILAVQITSERKTYVGSTPVLDDFLERV